MSCNHCGTNYSFFRKEMGCSNCGLSFCAKCLQFKIELPSKGNEKVKVCRICYEKLAKNNESSRFDNATVCPPDRYYKRLENMQSATTPVSTSSKNSVSCSRDLAGKDQNIIDRLNKLRHREKPVPSEEEIRKRLSILKEETIDYHQKNTSFENISNDRQHYLQPSDNPEEEVAALTQKIMEEVALEEKGLDNETIKTVIGSKTDSSGCESPELPWCILCNEDAKFKCYDCGGDLYCAECNNDVHTNSVDCDHNVVHYKPV